MKYTQKQIEAAKDNAKLRGYDRNSISDDFAVRFLDLYFDEKAKNDITKIKKQKIMWEIILTD